MKRYAFGTIGRFLGRLTGGFAGDGTDNLPAVILRGLAAEIERGAAAGGDKRCAPSDCCILLTREAMKLILPIRSELEENLRSALMRFAAEEGLSFSAPLRFRFAAGDGPGVALLSVRAFFGAGPPQEPPGVCDMSPTRVFRRAAGGKCVRAWLAVSDGPDRGREFALTLPEMRIGRLETNHLVLRDSTVSRNHARIVLVRGAYQLIDRGSANGTYVNGKRETRRRLRDGDRIRLGRTEMVFHMEGDAR